MLVKPPCETPCNDVIHYHSGLKGENTDKIMVILNRPDYRILLPSFFGDDYTAALINSKTGQKLMEMLHHCHLSLDDVLVTNVFKCVLKENREPRKPEYNKCVKLLEEQVDTFKPEKIIACGNKVYESMFPELAKETKFETNMGETFKYKETQTLIFYHPSKMFHSVEHRAGFYDIVKRFLRS